MKQFISIFLLAICISCSKSNLKETTQVAKEDFVWEGANLYFLLTDRFNNGDATNDVNFSRTKEAATLRGFKGGDLKGVTQKINSGYFTDLGINAIWMTPIVEQIHEGTDEGTGFTYAYHGYWTKDWTALDPNFGTKADLKALVDAAHKKGIRIVLDAVINHTGPETKTDTVWPKNWVRTGPKCTYDSYKNTVECTLVENLPDIKTESDTAVELPQQLIVKWTKEGRLEQELQELDAFFKRTGYPRAPRFYIIKWLTDYITEFGIDGYRVDTVKHTEDFVWQEFKKECDYAFNKFKQDNPSKKLDNTGFYLVGEVYNYGISNGKAFDYGDKKVDFFNNAFNSLINFELKWDVANLPANKVFKKYDSLLNSNLKNYGVLNYLTSHDDGAPFDKDRKKAFKAATLLLLTPGTSQVYYGDETSRNLTIANTQGDATLRSFMNWDDLETNDSIKKIHLHWQKLGQFRVKHPAVGAGRHMVLSDTKKGLVFSRVRNQDTIVAAIDLEKGQKVIDVSKVFKDKTMLFDFYSKTKAIVNNGTIKLDTPYSIALLEPLVN